MARRGKGNAYRGDRFTKKAKSQGYAARSVFKLEEMDKRFRLFRQGAHVVDLGCSPGSWSRYVAQMGCKLVGVDIQPTPGIPGVFLEKSALEVSADELLAELDHVDVMLSDMAPRTTGDKWGDHVRQIELARKALHLAIELETESFVVKVFDGAEAQAYTAEVRQAFPKLKRVKPEATRQRSVEFFLVGKRG